MTGEQRPFEEDSASIIGYEEDGVLWVTAAPDLRDAAAAERELGHYHGKWRVVEEVFVSPELGSGGKPLGGGDENWTEGSSKDPYALRAWRLVDVTRSEICVEGQEIANPHHQRK